MILTRCRPNRGQNLVTPWCRYSENLFFKRPFFSAALLISAPWPEMDRIMTATNSINIRTRPSKEGRIDQVRSATAKVSKSWSQKVRVELRKSGLVSLKAKNIFTSWKPKTEAKSPKISRNKLFFIKDQEAG